MPVVPFETLPDASRVWVFGSDKPLTDDGATALMKGVDEYLADWKAHGAPLTVGREWGCSIDGMFRTLQQLERSVGASLVGGGRVFYRGAAGAVQSAPRADVSRLSKEGAITKDTVVFDTSITDLGKFRTGFERRAKESWVAELL
jgi:hypothetical protein